MDLNKVIKDLRLESAALDIAIAALVNLKEQKGNKRGRPAKWMVEAKKQYHTKKVPVRRLE